MRFVTPILKKQKTFLKSETVGKSYLLGYGIQWNSDKKDGSWLWQIEGKREREGERERERERVNSQATVSPTRTKTLLAFSLFGQTAGRLLRWHKSVNALSYSALLLNKKLCRSETIAGTLINLPQQKLDRINPVGNYLFKVNNRKTRTRCEICLKLTIKTPKRCHWCQSGVFFVNFEHILHLILVFLLITLSRQMLAGKLNSLKQKLILEPIFPKIVFPISKQKKWTSASSAYSH